MIEYIIALLDLAEAEARAARATVARLVTGLVVLMAGGFLLVCGIGLCMSGVYAAFLCVFHGSLFAAGLVTGGIAVLLAGVMLWIGKIAIRR